MSSKQRGLALPTLMVMLSVASLAALLALRNLWVNDQLLNAQADHLRSQTFAEAVLPIAVQDILGLAATTESLDESTPNLRHTMGSTAQTHAFFPVSMSAYEVLRQRLASRVCLTGICAPLSPASGNKSSDWKAQTETAWVVSASESPDASGTAWYWVEVFPQETTHTFVYRITTLATGVRPGTATVLQALWTRDTPTSTTGQWHSWHFLHD
jgi:Tfp pilus assembly protein PilX